MAAVLRKSLLRERDLARARTAAPSTRPVVTAVAAPVPATAASRAPTAANAPLVATATPPPETTHSLAVAPEQCFTVGENVAANYDQRAVDTPNRSVSSAPAPELIELTRIGPLRTAHTLHAVLGTR